MEERVVEEVLEPIQPFTFTRTDFPSLTLQDALTSLPNLVNWFRATVENFAQVAAPPPPLSMTCFRSMIITHVLIGRLQSPNGERDQPFVYCTVTKEDSLMWRTYTAKVNMSQCAVFSTHTGTIREAAERRLDDINGARMAIAQGYILADEVDLLNRDIRSNRPALDLGHYLGFSGRTHGADARVRVQQWEQLRTTLAPLLQRWDTAVQADVDERFRETMLSRAAASWRAHHTHLSHGAGLTEENIDPYLFDYILNHGETKTWEPTIRTNAGDPIWFARQWTRQQHRGPFVNRNPGNRIFEA
jgi:hypothetical protein